MTASWKHSTVYRYILLVCVCPYFWVEWIYESNYPGISSREISQDVYHFITCLPLSTG